MTISLIILAHPEIGDHNSIVRFVGICFEFDGTATAESDGLLIHTQIWVAVVSIVVLVLGTGSWFWLWDHRKGNIQTSSC